MACPNPVTSALSRARVRAALGVAACLVLGPGPVAGAAPAPPKIGAVVVLKVPAGGSVSAVVRLSRPVPLEPIFIDALPARTMTVSGSSGPTLAVLRGVRRYRDELPAALPLLRLPAAAGGQVITAPLGVDPNSGQAIGYEQMYLPAGDYRIYTVTDKAATITLRIPGVTGPTLRLTTPGRRWSRISQIPVTTVAGRPASVSAQGETVEVKGNENVVFGVLAIDVTGQVLSSQTAGCWYHGRPPGDRFVPGCPTGTRLDASPIGAYVPPRSARGVVALGGLDGIGAGTWSAGDEYAIGGAVNAVWDYQVWLTY